MFHLPVQPSIAQPSSSDGGRSSPWRPIRSLAISALALPLLAACASGDQQQVEVACPQVAVVADTAEVVAFAPGRSGEQEGVSSRGRMLDFDGGCDVGPSDVQVNVTLTLAGERGPAASGNSADYQYFVAVVGPGGEILNKRVFDTQVTFDLPGGMGGSEEELVQSIPIASPEAARDYQVLLGFQLTEEQLAYNRERRAGSL